MALPFTAGQRLTAADLNTATQQGAWTTYTPTFSGTLGNGTIEGTYSKIGRLVTARVNLVWGSTTTSGNIAVGVPFASQAVATSPGLPYAWAGSVFAIPASGNIRSGVTVMSPSDSGMRAFSDNVSTNFWTATSPVTWTTATFVFQITYESTS